jgi:SnoaL-like protein
VEATQKTPLRAAMEASDHDAVVACFAPEISLLSPIFDVPFEGRKRAADLFAVLIEILDDLEYTAEIPGDPHVLHARASVSGTPLEIIDLLRFDDQGKIREMTVLLRPFPGIAAFMDAMAPKLGRRLKGGGTAAALRVLGGPPSLMMRLVARLGPRLLGLRKPPTE